MAGGAVRMSETSGALSTARGSWTQWAEAELGGAGLGDARLDQRLVAITASFMAAP